jgi:hypothetical protein
MVDHHLFLDNGSVDTRSRCKGDELEQLERYQAAILFK